MDVFVNPSALSLQESSSVDYCLILEQEFPQQFGKLTPEQQQDNKYCEILYRFFTHTLPDGPVYTIDPTIPSQERGRGLSLSVLIIIALTVYLT